jgi:putative spermidine/putrescine transport system substrate-binding protein
MNRKLFALLGLLMVVALILGACAQPTPEPTEAPTEAPVEAPTEAPAEEPLGLPGELAGMTWDEIVAAADGQEVNYWMWGGSDTINAWVNGWLADQLKEKYNITLSQVPVAGPTEFINQVLGEKEAGQDTDGAVDMMWINGENFRTMKEADLLYGPWAEQVPGSEYVNWDDPSVAYDFGYPVEGYELPYWKAQVAIGYDTAKIPEPPPTMEALIQWIRDNPGKFTYAAPPDFHGSAWMRMMCYYATGGYEQFLGDFDQALFDEKFPACWELLNELEPYLWREGETYPETIAALRELFAQGEIWFEMGYAPGGVQARIEAGQYPETVRTFVFEEGTIANTNYTAIAYNSPHKAAAVVAANFMLSPEAQYSALEILHQFPSLDTDLLPEEWREKFETYPFGPAVLSLDVLAAHRLPELQSPWLIAMEDGWRENVLEE